jgi:ParB family transcriptional regulator, chromosome partitioning protein
MAILKSLAIEQLQRGFYQPREQFSQTALQELADSIKSAGLIQPIVVRPIAPDQFEIVAGERRWRASQLAGLSTVPCLIHEYTDEQTAAVATIENVNRVDLNPIEEAQAYQRLYDEFAYSHEEIAAIVGKSRAKITNMLRLLKLNNQVQQLIRDNALSEGHGKLIGGLEAAKQIDFALQCVKHGWSVRRAESELKKSDKGVVESKKVDPNIKALSRALSDHIGCQVDVQVDEGQCDLKINCHSMAILEGVLKKLGFSPEKFEN